MSDPYDTFPFEVWEDFLLNLIKPKDTQTIFEAYPTLDMDVGNLKRILLIGGVLAPLCKMLSQKDILNLRLVSKQWKQRVDNFLVNQPYYRAQDGNYDKRFWNFLESYAENYVECDSPIICCRMLPYQTEVVDQLLGYSTQSNPLVFRELRFDLSHFTEFNHDILKITKVITRFGPSVWYLTLLFSGTVRFKTLDHIQSMLYHSNNVKSLKILFNNGNVSLERKKWDWKRIDLPKLTELETIHVGLFKSKFKALVVVLLKKYGYTIKRLNAPAYALIRLSTNFGNLTELFITVTDDIIPERVGYRRYEQLQVLDVLEAPKLKCLSITYQSIEKNELFVNVEEDVFGWLSRFPNIVYFAFTTNHVNSNDNVLVLFDSGQILYPPDYEISSLKILKLVDSDRLSYNFLYALPNLIEFEIKTRVDPQNVNPLVLENCRGYRRDIIGGTLGESTIWHDHVKLNKITVISHYGEPEPFDHVRHYYKP